MTQMRWTIAATGEAVLPDPLLRTKLYIPSPPLAFVPRPRLIARLNDATARPLTLVSAPAGFGKTTLLSDWARQSPVPVAWVSLDPGDSDLVHFWSYVIAALQTVRAGLGEDAQAMLRAPQPLAIEPLLATLLNEVVAGAARLALVLDDYQVIDSPAVHDSVAFLLDHLPPQIHLVISCRAAPLLPLARLRGRGQLIELRAADLRFTLEEATAFLNQVMELGLAEKDVAALEDRTEGWIAGLQLAALSMQGREDGADFVAAFAGNHRHILDYLTEEVILRQPPNVQSFLLQTSILGCLCGPLCDAVTGRDDGQTMLEGLEAANLFLVPLDDQRQWYRYHHLFADLLRSRLRSWQPELVPTLHRRASEWYESECYISDALPHALAAGDTERAVRLVEQNSGFAIRSGEISLLLEWLQALPADVVRARPRLSVAYAWALLHGGQVNAVEPRLQDAERALELGVAAQPLPEEAHEVERLRAEIALIRPLAARCQGEPERSLDLVQQAFQRVLAEDAYARGLFCLSQGDIALERDDLAGALQAYAEAVPLCQAAGNSLGAMTAAASLMVVHSLQGQLHRAAEVFRQMKRACDEQAERDGCPIPATGLIYVGMGNVLYEWNELDAAEEHFQEGLALAESGGHLEALREGYGSLAWVRRAHGDAQGALQAMERAEQAAHQADLPHYAAKMAARRARLYLALGDLESAVRWVQDLESKRGSGPDDLYDYLAVSVARVRIAQAQAVQNGSYLQEVLPLLERRLGAAEAAGNVNNMIVILGLQALAWQVRGRIDRALEALGRALALGEPENYTRTFADAGEPMAALLRQAVARGVMPHYAGRLLEVLSTGPRAATAMPAVPTGGPAEALSERELAVLHLVAAGLTNREIAAELVISLNTVKTHIKSIYGKLGVRSRTQALKRAHELALL